MFHFIAVLSGLLLAPAFAENEASAEKREAQAWLNKIKAAAQKLNYSGVFVYQQANQVRTSRITHLVDGKNELEKLEVLDGRPREYIRNNEQITYYLPDVRVLQVERRITAEIFPAILAASAAEIAEHYAIRRQETGRVAGFDVQAILLEPKDHLRYGYKLWAEKNTGLLLRAQTLDEEGKAVEQIAFTQLEIHHIDRNRVKPSYTNTSRWRLETAVMNPASLSGWSVKSVPPGFKKIRELTRIVSETSAPNSSNAGAAGTSREVAQIVFSDGLAAISIFIESSAQSRTDGSMRQGAMNIIGKRQGDYWITIVGEVPAVAIRQVANSIEFKPK
jgi:sigma-E factor negative regulatory protein RseB